MSLYNKDKYIAKKWEHDRTAFNSDVSGFSRVYLIADEIAKGTTYRQIALRFSKEWNVSPNYIRSMVLEAIGLFLDETYYKNIRDINNERLTDIYLQAREKDDLDTAIKAIDKLNKANGVYDTLKTQVSVQTEDNNITITFGGVPLDLVLNNTTEAPFNEVDLLLSSLNKKEDE